MARILMSDAQWAFFEVFIQMLRKPKVRKFVDHRRLPDGVLWVARMGAPWRDPPKGFRQRNSVYRQFRRWALAGLWQTIFEVLHDSDIVPDCVQMIDGTTVGAYHCAGGAKRGAQIQDLGRSKGGFTTKIHLLVNARDLLVKAEISAGQVSDYGGGYDAVMDDDLPQPKVLLADKGYGFDAIRKDIERCGGTDLISQSVNMT